MCKKGYFLSTKSEPKCLRMDTVPNCAAYSMDDEKCVFCKPRFGLKNNRCESCSIRDCITCNVDTNMCSSCFPHSFPDDPSHITKCTRCPSNCTTCNEEGICTSCPIQYYLKDDECMPCLDANCEVCYYEGKCSVCRQGLG